MQLTIDIGNTRAKLGWFQGNALVAFITIDAVDEVQLKKVLYNHPIEKIIFSSTGKLDAGFLEGLKTSFRVVVLDHHTPIPIGMDYSTPHTLGRDRIAAAVGAWHIMPQKNCLIIDAGTCITMDVLSKEGTFLGGNISPGVDMRLKAMHHFTARLPLLERTAYANRIGDSTATAMLNGAQLGAVLEVQGFIRWCRRQFPDLVLLITGGDHDFFVKQLKTKIFADPYLVLVGLNQIIQRL